MIIESGIIIFFGMLLLGIKLPRHVSLKLLGRPLALDLGVSVLAYVLHYGTFSGIMAAAVAGLMCSGFELCALRVRLHQGQAISQRSHLATSTEGG